MREARTLMDANPSYVFFQEVRGETAHSGPTPMAARRNALVGAAMLIVFIKAVGDFGVPSILGGEFQVLPTLIYYQIHGFFNLNGASAGLNSRLQEARWFVKNILQRFDTIQRVSQAIVERQKSFFTHGAIAMKPLVLREIADELGLHESTISRVTTAKYMSTPFGTFELKYFFNSGRDGILRFANSARTAARSESMSAGLMPAWTWHSPSQIVSLRPVPFSSHMPRNMSGRNRISLSFGIASITSSCRIRLYGATRSRQKAMIDCASSGEAALAR